MKYKYIYLKKNDKNPFQKKWGDLGRPIEDLIHLVPSQYNIGVVLGVRSNCIMDVDLDGAHTVEAGALLLPETDMITGRDIKPASHYFYIVDGALKTIQFLHPITDKMLVELRGDGAQTMMPPSIHPNDRQVVRFEPGRDGAPAQVGRAILEAAVGQIAVVSVLADFWVEGDRHCLALWFAGLCACSGVDQRVCESVVRTLCTIMRDAEADDRLKAVQTTYARGAEGKPVEWRSKLIDLLGSEKAVDAIIKWMGGTKTDLPRVISKHSAGVLSTEIVDVRLKCASDLAIAESFRDYLSGKLIYADSEGLFYKQKEGVYDPISIAGLKGEIANFVKSPACDPGENNPDIRRKLQSLATINSTADLSKSLLGTDDNFFDTDDHLLGTENGVLDLSTFALVYTDSIVTKRIGTRFIPGAQCPNFERYLNEVFEGDQEKIAYLRRALGYTLTGSVAAQVMFILTGKGANGKSVLLKLIAALMGTYGAALPSHTIVQQKFGNDKTDDLASLSGKRFVVASEGDVGDRLAIAKVKRMVAGDPIAVRRLYGSYFNLRPTFKLWFGSNDLPQISGTDYAIWRRIHVIEFTRTFEPRERDPLLLDKLKTELPGILNWILDGLREIGEMKGDFLAPPISVQRSVDEYRADNDNVSKFLGDKCVRDPASFVSMSALYNSYRSWCHDNAVECLTNNMFGKELSNLGFEVVRKNYGKARKGLKMV